MKAIILVLALITGCDSLPPSPPEPTRTIAKADETEIIRTSAAMSNVEVVVDKKRGVVCYIPGSARGISCLKIEEANEPH